MIVGAGLLVCGAVRVLRSAREAPACTSRASGAQDRALRQRGRDRDRRAVPEEHESGADPSRRQPAAHLNSAHPSSSWRSCCYCRWARWRSRSPRACLQVPRACGWPLIPLIPLFCVVDSFANNISLFDVLVMLVMLVAGVVALFMERRGFPVAPTILGVVLSTMLEEHFFSSLVKADGNVVVFFERPIAGVLGDADSAGVAVDAMRRLHTLQPARARSVDTLFATRKTLGQTPPCASPSSPSTATTSSILSSCCRCSTGGAPERQQSRDRQPEQLRHFDERRDGASAAAAGVCQPRLMQWIFGSGIDTRNIAANSAIVDRLQLPRRTLVERGAAFRPRRRSRVAGAG